MTNKKKTAKKSPEAVVAVSADALRDLLGYLNFSQGAASPRFRATLNDLFRDQQRSTSPRALRDFLLAELQRLSTSGDVACADPAQAEAIIRLTLDELLPAYHKHHADLLSHLAEVDHYAPLLLARMFEAILKAKAEFRHGTSDQVITAALQQLNHFVGYRPVAVLENGRRSEIYSSERFCPLPLYFSEVGAAVGPYEQLIESTIAFMRDLPDDLVSTSHFSIDRMAELSLDMRSHDHLHPVNKRTNYVFGEWDPDEIDTKGFYRRFIVRRLIIDSLIDWIHQDGGKLDPERLFDASAVLAGTILMASAISGSGPQTYDSSVSLTSLLPIVARQRDNFYQRLLDTAKGERAKRLKRLANESRQPFGHVRHELNMYLSKYGADQVQHRHLSWMFARMGFEEASCEEASVIPCLSARFESEIQSRLVMVPRLVRNGELETAQRMLTEVMDLLHRGIECGGLVDPWNILGFQGLFPLFFTREDSIPDSRVEVLLDIMGQIFDACTLAMSEAAASGKKELHGLVLENFSNLAEHWDRYATTTVNDLTHVEGMKSVDAATQVARVLTAWRTAGESAGDLSFWRQHVEDFDATRSFAQVVTALLDRKDHVAAMGLLMQWLSRAETVPLENGPHSIHRLLHRLLQCICDQPEPDVRWNNLRRLFAFMEANAGACWEIPSLGEFAELHKKNRKGGKDERDDLDLEHLFDADEPADNLFEAAWENVTYNDSTDDGNASDTMDSGAGPGTTEFEILYRQIEPRLKFLHTVGSLWGIAAVWVSRSAATTASATTTDAARENQKEHLREWLASIRGRLHGLSELVREVRDYEIAVHGSGLEGNIEYDIQMQCRLLLMQNALSTTVEFLMAERLIGAIIAEEPVGGSDKDSSLDRQLSRMFTAVFAQDVNAAKKCFPALCKELKRRPLLYVPFENGGQPAAILKARMLQSVIRVLLSQLPRLGLLEETFELLQTALQMERTLRPSGQAVTEFDRLFRIGLSSSVECILQSAGRWKTESPRRVQTLLKRVQKLLDSYSDLWTRHSGSMRLSIVEDLHDDEFAAEVKEFIEKYGDDLFHTRMLTLGNARAILHHGAESMFDELQETVALTQTVPLLEDFESGEMDREDAAEMAEFVYECVVDNFDRFLEYNTTTTHSDYGNRLYCLLDFLRLEALYDRFEWNTIPWQVAHESMVRSGDLELAAGVEEFVDDESRGIANSFVEELEQLESEYGVRLPALHDHVGERILGALAQNRMAALVSRSCPGTLGLTHAEVETNFASLRREIADFMGKRIGSGIEPPEWMQRLAGELDRVQDGRPGALSDSLMDGDFQKLTQRAIDQQLAGITKLNDAAGSGL